MQEAAEAVRRSGKTIGFVPTMGFLHEGHLSLLRAARAACDLVVVSIFVNPLQFGAGEDYEAYPRNPEGDARKCEVEGTDILFTPTTGEMYPPGRFHLPRSEQRSGTEPDGQWTVVEVPEMGDVLCGAVRPGHFRGVATVVAKLFHIVKPHRAYLGQKDYQQTVIIRRMVRDLNMDVEVVVLPTVREADGLAMSSRNSYLSQEERKAAPVLYRALREAERRVAEGERSARRILAAMEAVVSAESLARIDYLALVDPETLVEVEVVTGSAVALGAVRIGKTRLIDNLLLKT
jgi:pantoate--beta-alanine ligase